MITLINQAQSKQQIVEYAFTLYKENLHLTWPYSLLSCFFILAPQLIFLCFEFETPWDLPINLFIWLGLPCWIVGFTLLSGLLFRYYCLGYQIPSTFTGSLGHALTKLPILLLLTALYAFLVVGGTMVLFIPGIIFAISFMFCFLLVLSANQSVLQALLGSHRLVWGHWWHTLLVMAIPLLLNLTITAATWLCVLGALLKFPLNLTHLYCGIMLSNLVIQTLLIPFIMAVAFVLFHDLRQRAPAPLVWN